MAAITQEQFVETLRIIHAREEYGDCVEDGDPYPCRTIRLLEMFMPSEPPAPQKLGCDCNPREATLDADLNIVCAECGAILRRTEL
jgi:hypothetical protein